MYRRAILTVLLILLIALFLVGLAADFWVDWLWFSAVGYWPVFWKVFRAQSIVFLASTLIAFSILLVNGYLAHALTQRARRAWPPDLDYFGGAQDLFSSMIGESVPWGKGIVVVALLLSMLLGAIVPQNWEALLKYTHQVPLGYSDPIFNLDIGFYLFSLPVYLILKNWLMLCLLLTAIIVTATYWIKGGIHFRYGRPVLSNAATVHLSVLAAAFFSLKSWSFYLDRFLLLYDSRGVVFGAGYTDINFRLPVLKALVFLSALAAALCLINAYVRKLKLIAAAAVLVFGVSILVEGLASDIYQRYLVKPNELTLERPYLENNIKLTQLAYDLTDLNARAFPAAGQLTPEVLAENASTINNIRLWDWRPITDTYKQLQAIRLYYTFHDVDVDRYQVEGRYQQVMIAARELDQSLLPEDARTWVNMHLKYTHGYGLVMSPVTEKNAEGLPIFYLKDIPPVSPAGIKINEPRIYYGERTYNYVIVKAATEEFDYPKGKDNVYTIYQGKGDVPIGSLLGRLLFAWRFKDINLIFSSDITSDSHIMIYRPVQERVRKIAPFLHLDRDPYIVISQGRLYWIQDAYTTSRYFPYAQSYELERGALNYIRNSVKAIVDAYNGTVSFYVSDPKDPIIATYRSIFPELFKDLKDMPEGLKKHIRYPEDLFSIQAQMYGIYHMSDPQVFYNKEDLWEFPKENYGGEIVQMRPYYTIMRLPGEEREEFILMLPLVPRNRDNMIAWMAARCDAPNYGELIVFEFPKDKLIYGPSQIEARIDQDTIISQQLTLWNQMGSRVIRGNLLVIPIDDTLLYVEPIYLQAEKGQMPELKRVVACHGERVIMEETLETALARLFAGAEATATQPPQFESTAALRELRNPIQQALDHYNRAMNALKKGDWAGFGSELKALEELLKELNAKFKAE